MVSESRPCRSCGEHMDQVRVCPTCKEVDWRCSDCHNELTHGVIPLGTVHLVGNSVPGMGVDEDPDAYRRATHE